MLCIFSSFDFANKPPSLIGPSLISPNLGSMKLNKLPRELNRALRYYPTQPLRRPITSLPVGYTVFATDAFGVVFFHKDPLHIHLKF